MVPYSNDPNRLSSQACEVGSKLQMWNDKAKTRHPRWTRQETYVLIEGKQAVEDQIQRDRRSTSANGSGGQTEPKWDSISAHCKQHGVNREPVQCRKRWNNMLVDFRKIKAWESQEGEDESFWAMRNELRKEKKLPSFFDKEVYDVLDGRAFVTDAIPLSMVTVKTETYNADGDEAVASDEEEEGEHEESEAVFDNSQHATANNAPFSDSEHSGQDQNGSISSKETTATENPKSNEAKPLPVSGSIKLRIPGSNTWTRSTYQEGQKRRKLSSDGTEETDLKDQWMKVLKRNGDMLSAQVEAQNINSELDRNQRKEQNDGLISALNKIADSLVRIADKI